jgi:hypothetical protein
MSEHSPLPWHFYELPDREPDGCGYIRSGDQRFEVSHHGDTGRSRAENLANADLIIRAVNAHADLVAALDDLCDVIESDEEHGAGADEPDCPICDAIRKARAALAKVIS